MAAQNRIQRLHETPEKAHDTDVTVQYPRALKVAAICIGVTLLAGAALLGGGAYELSHAKFSLGNIDLAPNINVGPQRTRTKPTIAVPRSACPYLKAVNDTADAAGENWEEALGYEIPQTWRPFARQLAPKLANLELALIVSIPRVPAPVAADFRQTLQAVKAGRPPLLTSNTVDDYSNRSNFGVFMGYLTLGEVSGFVGDACGFEFGPGAT